MAQKPILTLEEALTLLTEDYSRIQVINAQGKVEFDGELGEIRHAQNVEHYDKLRKRIIHQIDFNDYNDFIVYLADDRVQPYTMSDFPPKKLLVVDILNWVDKKELLVIWEPSDGECMDTKLFAGRAEDLQFTEEGVLHELGTRVVSFFEAGKYNEDYSAIIIWLEREEKDGSTEKT